MSDVVGQRETPAPQFADERPGDASKPWLIETIKNSVDPAREISVISLWKSNSYEFGYYPETNAKSLRTGASISGVAEVARLRI